MGNESSLLIKINADAAQALKQFDAIKAKTEDLQGVLDKVTKFSAVAFAALTAEIGFSTHAFAENDLAARQLNLAIQNQGLSISKLLPLYKEYSAQVAEQTGIEDGALTKAQAVAQSYLGQIPITRELTQAIADLGSQMGGDFTGAAEKIARTIGTNTNAFARQGLILDDTATRAERYQKVIDYVSVKTAGSAEAADQASLGFNGLRASVNRLQENLGSQFAPAIETAVRGMKSFIDFISNNTAIVGFTAAMIAGAAAIAAIGTAIPIIVSGFVTLQAALVTLNVTLTATQLAVTLLAGATGIGLLIAAFGFLTLNMQSSEAALAKFKGHLPEAQTEIAKLKAELAKLNSVNPNLGFDGFNEAQKKAISDKIKALESIVAADEEIAGKRKVIADKEEAQRQRRDAAERNALLAQRAAIVAIINRDGDKVIESKQKEAEILQQIAQQENEQQIAVLQQLYERQREITDQEHLDQLERDKEFRIARAEANAELDSGELANTDILRAQQIEASRAQAMGELEVSRKISQDVLDDRIKKRNLELEDRKRYGAAVAQINSVLRSNEIEAAKSISGELVALAQSKNSTLKAIGKAAAIAQITIATAESAVTLTQQIQRVVPFPFSVPVIAALVGARIAFGAEQIANVRGAARGALVEGPGSGDTQPFMLEPGELVAPRKNFDEVVGSVRSSRNSRDDDIVALLDEIAGKQLGNTVVQVSGDILADDTYIDRLGKRIGERVVDGNLRIAGLNA
jgi:hypothetical protein